jgi:hypothetical protein
MNQNDANEKEYYCVEGSCKGSILFPLTSFFLCLKVHRKCAVMHMCKVESNKSYGLDSS